MPILYYCRFPGCNRRIHPAGYCDKHKDRAKKDFDRNRLPSSKRGYNSQWRKARKGYLAKHPLCVLCLQQGRTEAATVVDHIVPHRGNTALFWDKTNWQALCTYHHGVKTRLESNAKR